MIFNTECVCLWFGTQTMEVAVRDSVAFTTPLIFFHSSTLLHLLIHLLSIVERLAPPRLQVLQEKTPNWTGNYCYLSLPARRQFPVIFRFCEPIDSFQRTLGRMCFVLNLVLNNISQRLSLSEPGRTLEATEAQATGISRCCWNEWAYINQGGGADAVISLHYIFVLCSVS